MKKIGLLTLTPSHNYGGTLQCLALYSYLKTQGYQVTLIDKQPYHPVWKSLLIKLLGRIPYQNIKGIRTSYLLDNAHKSFIDNNIVRRTSRCFTTRQLQRACKAYNFDAIIVGSDQVWRMQYLGGSFFSNYFLDFVDGERLKKISYAASFGKDEWEDAEKIPAIKKLLGEFRAVSVREDTGVQICAETFQRNDVVHVLDPTLLVSVGFYSQFIEENFFERSRSTLLTYILDADKEKEKVIKCMSNFISGDTVVHHLLGFDKTEKNYSVGEWLTAFYYADFIVTDSYHGMVFSIIFNKQFVVIGNRERGMSRFSSLLKALELSNRLVESVESLQDFAEIDYAKVNMLIENKRQHSANYLLQAIND